MHDDFQPGSLDEDDAATMVAQLRERLDDATLARAMGVRESELDLVAAGYQPKPEALQRLRLLHEAVSRTEDLRDPGALLAALGASVDPSGRMPLSLMPNFRMYLIAFLVLDALVVGGAVVAFLILR